ncbi:oxytocin-neurophysin 1 [Tupaia chinensis]|uniref:Oxytocin-neurophysin 1 n=1 Tax=Tupaia chinensis TaxID=246437 RepID=L8Y8Q4_TUPCH|nr:oxytocin-neurophysin 1 [Tupaia chinensis]ELV12818.1 Oxytocin-neurophysin 1 [Tupaia chinensis]
MASSSLACCLLGLLALTSACYIQNCPPGGKRALLDLDVRKCLPCGPGGRGHCFGSKICCDEELGCFLGPTHSQSCEKEDYLPTPCQSGGKPCGNRATCAAAGFCCSPEGCHLDPDCDTKDIFSEP